MGVRKYRDIEIQGRVYATVQAAADHFTCTPENVVRAIKAGRTHRLGAPGPKIEPCPVLIRGVTYSSARVAAKVLGVTPSAIWQALSQNRIDGVGMGARCPNPHRSMPFAMGGLRWPSMRAASLDLGFRPEYVAHAYRKGRRSAQERILAAAMALAARREQSARVAFDRAGSREAEGHAEGGADWALAAA